MRTFAALLCLSQLPLLSTAFAQETQQTNATPKDREVTQGQTLGRPRPPTVTTLPATLTTATGAALVGSFDTNGIDTHCWFLYGSSPTLAGATQTQTIDMGTVQNLFVISIVGLTPATTYYFQLQAENFAGTSSGAIQSFTTRPALPPTASLSPNMGATGSATELFGTVNPNGAETHYWFVYGIDPSLADASQTPVQDAGSGVAATSVLANVTGLMAGMKYYYQLQASNAYGEGSSTVETFTTSPPPTVGGGPAFHTADYAASSNYFTLNGTVNPNGFSTLYWFVSGTDPGLNGGTATAGAAAGTGSGTLVASAQVSGLAANQTYYFQLQAMNVNGTTKGPIESFSTAQGGGATPVVTTGSASGISGSGATLSGTVNPGGSDTQYWFIYANNPTLIGANSTLMVDGGAGNADTTVSATVSGLAVQSTYYFQIVAANVNGISIGSNGSFTTGVASPTVTTGNATPGTFSSKNGASLNGMVNPNGVATNWWFAYGTSPTLAGASETAVNSAGSGTAPFPVGALITGLPTGLTYYYQLQASNSAGAGSGAILSFVSDGEWPTVTTGSASAVTASSATLNGTVNPNGVETSFEFQYTTDSTSVDEGTATGWADAGSGTNPVSASAAITGLAPGTTYYFRLKASSFAPAQGEISSFTTGTLQPVVTTGPASGITTTSVTLSGFLNPNGAATQYWFLYGTNERLAGASQSASFDAGSGVSAVPISMEIDGLSPGTTYYFELQGSNAAGKASGNVGGFTTSASTQPGPSAITGAVTSVTASGAMLLGTLDANGADTHYWFVYGTDSTLAGANQTTSTDAGSGTAGINVATSLLGLAPSTVYYYQLVASNSHGSSHGAVLSFTTAAQPQPTVVTGAVASLTINSVTLTGTVNPNGADTQYWFLYGTSSTLAGATQTGNVDAGAGTTAASASVGLSGLTAGTTYYYQVVASNSGGTAYGSILSFVTTNQPPPTVTTGAASSIISSSATVTGTINPNGSETHFWYLYGTSSTLSGASQTPTMDAGSLTRATLAPTSLSGLANSTTYYYQLVATNGGGTSYGAILSFSTPSQALPTVVTLPATLITNVSAYVNGTVNPNGGIAQVWYLFGTNPSLTGATQSVISDFGPFNTAAPAGISFTGLAINTTYYYQLIASNNAGTSYGAILSFTTVNAQPPAVITGAAISITATGATLTGTVNPNGYYTTYYFWFGGAPPPLNSSDAYQTSATVLGSGTVPVTVSVPLPVAFAPNSTGYYQLVAQSSAGITYGLTLSFTTLPPPPPTVVTLPIYYVAGNTSTSLALNGTVNPNGADARYWFLYGTSPTLSGATQTPVVDLGWWSTPQQAYFFTTGLSANTTYYYQLVASNSGGTTYGAILSFLGPSPPVVTTGAIASMSSDGAVATGTVDPNGYQTLYWFLYSTNNPIDPLNTNQSEFGGAGSGPTPVAVTSTLTTLQAGVTIYYQLVASNTNGTTYGSVMSYTPSISSSPSLATAVTGSASSVTSNSATLAGTINPNGLNAFYVFQYGTSSTFYAASDAVGPSVGSGFSAVPVTANITGLTPNTTYYYRLLALNQIGTGYGNALTFTTTK